MTEQIIVEGLTEDEKQGQAEFVLNSVSQATASVQQYSTLHWKDAGFKALTTELARHVDRAATGDMTQLRHTLAAQIITLDAIFHALLQRAMDIGKGTHKGLNSEILSLALRCQKQSVQTAAILSGISISIPQNKLLNMDNEDGQDMDAGR